MKIDEDCEDNKESKVLGITWNHQEDVFKLGVKEIFENAVKVEPTKRNVLKIIASI